MQVPLQAGPGQRLRPDHWWGEGSKRQITDCSLSPTYHWNILQFFIFSLMDGNCQFCCLKQLFAMGFYLTVASKLIKPTLASWGGWKNNMLTSLMFHAGSFLKDDFAQGVLHIHLMTKSKSPHVPGKNSACSQLMIQVKDMEIKKQPCSCISM